MNSTTKKITIVIAFLFFILFFMIRYYFENKDYRDLEGTWVTKEVDRNDFKIHFYSSDSLLIEKDSQSLKKRYAIYSDELQIFDKNSVEIKYNFQLINDELILINGKDKLVFYKINSMSRP